MIVFSTWRPRPGWYCRAGRGVPPPRGWLAASPFPGSWLGVVGGMASPSASIDEIGTGQVAGWGYRSAGGLASGSLGGVTLRLYDTATRSEREFSPVEPGKASLYLCGATVQARSEEHTSE